MPQPIKDQTKKTKYAKPFADDTVNKNKQKTEQNEVAGRHKNDGQKDHKGAR